MGLVIFEAIAANIALPKFQSQDHIERVKIGCPPDRILVYSVTEGWDPLCKFLGVEVPSEEFPHENSRTSMSKVLTKANRIGWLIIVVTLGTILLFPP